LTIFDNIGGNQHGLEWSKADNWLVWKQKNSQDEIKAGDGEVALLEESYLSATLMGNFSLSRTLPGPFQLAM
jgi:hypothetical protein